MRFLVAVKVMPKAGISDPQGQTIERALPRLGFAGIETVRVGKHIEFMIDSPDEAVAAETVGQACERFLANPVIEDFFFDIEPAAGHSAADQGDGRR